MKRKIQKVYEDYGFGFPVTLLNVPLIKIRGEWVPDINQQELQVRVTRALVLKPTRLTGGEVRFIRLFSQMTLEKFADRFDVTHPCVLKWENASNRATGMAWTTEKDIRLFALDLLKPKLTEFHLTYQMFEKVLPEHHETIKINFAKVA